MGLCHQIRLTQKFFFLLLRLLIRESHLAYCLCPVSQDFFFCYQHLSRAGKLIIFEDVEWKFLFAKVSLDTILEAAKAMWLILAAILSADVAEEKAWKFVNLLGRYLFTSNFPLCFSLENVPNFFQSFCVFMTVFFDFSLKMTRQFFDLNFQTK